jgi:hypothetical protein
MITAPTVKAIPHWGICVRHDRLVEQITDFAHIGKHHGDDGTDFDQRQRQPAQTRRVQCPTLAQQGKYRNVEWYKYADRRVGDARRKACILAFDEEYEREIGKREREEDKKGAATPEGETEQESAREHQVRPVNFEARQIVRKNCVSRQQQGHRPKTQRNREIAQYFSDGYRGVEFLDHEFVANCQIHVTSKAIAASRLGRIRPILVFRGCTHSEHPSNEASLLARDIPDGNSFIVWSVLRAICRSLLAADDKSFDDASQAAEPRWVCRCRCTATRGWRTASNERSRGVLCED